MFNHPDWINGFIGGMMIGLSASLLMLSQGRICGISGIAGGLIKRHSSTAWRWLFIIGLALGVLVYSLLHGALPKVEISSSILLLVIAGLLVGFGTRLGNGCTSGHGICGIARCSKRSIAATMSFMATAIVTVWLMTLVTAS